jgi:Na+-translocating ferredoxin:NAD+ oxidoreductase RnfG subunit
MSTPSRLILLPVAALAVCAPAQAMVYLSVEQAQKLMFGEQVLTPLLLTLTAEQVAAVEHDSGVRVISRSLRAWRAADGGAFLVDAVIGKHDLITYALAIGADGKLRQVEIMEYREAYGGDVRNPRWRAQFNGKQHGDSLQVGEDIQGISGATLSCEHVTEGIRRMLATYALVIHGT